MDCLRSYKHCALKFWQKQVNSSICEADCPQTSGTVQLRRKNVSAVCV